MGPERDDEAKRTLGESQALMHARKARSWAFVATCPGGHESEQANLDRTTLARRLADDVPIALRCKTCGVQWDATPEQRDRLRWAIRNLP